MFYLGRLISAFFNQLFRWLFWNKTGQKVLFIIVIFAIAVCFIKLGEVSAVSEVEDINYEVQSYYDNLVNEAILRLENNWDNYISSQKESFLNPQRNFYWFYGSNNGSSYNNAVPLNTGTLYCAILTKGVTSGFTATSYDYMGITGYTMYTKEVSGFYLSNTGEYTSVSNRTFYIPFEFISSYRNENWVTYINAKRNGDTETIIALLESIQEDLSNTTPDQESEDSIIVDSSATDSVDTSEIDSVFSSAFTSFANKFTYYDLSDADQWVITINGTRIVLRSDILYNMIHNTWFYPMLQLLWYYIFGHYAFVWLTNLIHKIKDGSILDGLEVNEVISKEML